MSREIERIINECSCVDTFDYVITPQQRDTMLLAEHLKRLEQKNRQLREKVEYLTGKIENKDRWCQLIADIGYDYDGYNDSDNLKTLIDELVRYALNSRDDYDYLELLSEGKNEPR